MEKIRNIHTFDHNIKDILLKHYSIDTLFFDIETTGFSSAHSHLYMIGSAYFKDEALIVEQFFAPSSSDEPKLLQVFSNLLMQFSNFLTFNGNGFDLPYLKGCYTRLKMEMPDLCGKNFIDIYKHFSNYQSVFRLENLKQKTLEAFLGSNRKDTYSGGGLIEVYRQYQKNQDESLLQLLLLHNYEDMLGMASLLQLYVYDEFFEGGFKVSECSILPYRTVSGENGEELFITCLTASPLPAAISCNKGSFYLRADGKKAVFRIPLYKGELKYFYPNYKEYYYLPAEDMAIHKSVAAYVDKQHRQKAAANTCYTKKTGVFLPQHGEWATPAFYSEYKDRTAYFELTDAFFKDYVQLKQYCMHILKYLKSKSD